MSVVSINVSNIFMSVAPTISTTRIVVVVDDWLYPVCSFGCFYPEYSETCVRGRV